MAPMAKIGFHAAASFSSFWLSVSVRKMYIFNFWKTFNAVEQGINAFLFSQQICLFMIIKRSIGKSERVPVSNMTGLHNPRPAGRIRPPMEFYPALGLEAG